MGMQARIPGTLQTSTNTKDTPGMTNDRRGEYKVYVVFRGTPCASKCIDTYVPARIEPGLPWHPLIPSHGSAHGISG